MRKRIRHYIGIALAILAGLGLNSCYKEIDLEEYHTYPKLVLNAFCNPDTIVIADLSHTWFYTEENVNPGVSDATVELYIDDVFQERMERNLVVDMKTEYSGIYRKDTLYTSRVIPREGQRIRIQATSPIYGIVTAEDAIPRKGKIRSATVIPQRVNIEPEDTSYTARFQITIQDPPEETNYYAIELKNIHYNDYYGPFYHTSLETILLDLTFDPVFQQQSVIDNIFGFLPESSRVGLFTDETFNGGEYTLNLKYAEQAYSPSDNIELEVRLHTISEPFFRYLYSLQLLHDDSVLGKLIEYGLADPMRVYSNVEGGTGILASYRQDTLPLRREEFFPR